MNSSVSPHAENQQPNRREFLYYLSGASLLLLTGGVGIGLSKYLNPPPVYGERSGVFKIDLKEIPETNGAPKYFREGHYWLVNTSNGLIALDAWCPFHNEAKTNWYHIFNSYICPSCGSKFHINGDWIEGAAKRGLDHFQIEVTTEKGTVTTPIDGSPVSLEGAQQVVISSIGRIPGKPRFRDKFEFIPPIGNS